jgi:hypothetical protein
MIISLQLAQQIDAGLVTVFKCLPKKDFLCWNAEFSYPVHPEKVLQLCVNLLKCSEDPRGRT